MKGIFLEFKAILRDFGIEYFNRFYSVYRGKVFDNQDPEFLGRLRVTVPQVYKDKSPNIWATQMGANAGKESGVFWIPSIGDPIYIMFEGGDPRFPVWTYGWWTKGSVPGSAQRKKPNNYVFQTPGGLMIELDDEKEVIDLKNKEGFHLQITKDGFFMGDKNSNLGKLVGDLFTLYEQTRTATKLGPQGFINIANYTKLSVEFKKLLTDAPK